MESWRSFWIFLSHINSNSILYFGCTYHKLCLYIRCKWMHNYNSINHLFWNPINHKDYTFNTLSLIKLFRFCFIAKTAEFMRGQWRAKYVIISSICDVDTVRFRITMHQKNLWCWLGLYLFFTKMLDFYDNISFCHCSKLW